MKPEVGAIAMETVSRMSVAPSALAGLIGVETVSDWVEIDQTRIDAFADATDDHQFIHIDEARAKATPFGGTIAHGFLTLSLLSRMAYDAMHSLEGATMGVNYGLESVRFLDPVRSGSRVRGRFTLRAATEKAPGRWLLTYDVTVEVEGRTKPALAAQWLAMQIVG